MDGINKSFQIVSVGNTKETSLKMFVSRFRFPIVKHIGNK